MSIPAVSVVRELETGIEAGRISQSKVVLAASGLQRRFQLGAVIAGVGVALDGAGHLSAWLAGAMAPVGHSVITMKTNAALGLLLAGVALVVVAAGGSSKVWLRAARICAAVVLALGVLTLSEHISGWNLGLDELLAKEPSGALGVSSPNRPGPPGALGLALAGGALLILSERRGRKVKWAQGLALGLCVLGLLGVLGYLYQVRGLYALERFTGIAWPMALGLLVLGFGLLCARPGSGLMALVTAADPGGMIVRRVVPPTIGLLILLGWLRLLGEQRGLYETPLGTGLLVLGFVVVFTALVYWTAHKASAVAIAERQAQGVLERQARLIDLAPVATIVRELDGTIRFWSEGARQLYGWSREEALGRRTHELLRTEFPEPLERIVAAIEQKGRWCGDLKHHTKDGRLLVVQSWWGAQLGPDGRTMELLESNVDVTEREWAEEALRRSRTLLSEAERLSHTGAWEWDLEQDRWTFSEEWLRLHGCPSRHLSPDELLSIAHPAERGVIAEAFEKLRQGVAPYELEHRIVRLNDGAERVVRARGQFVRDAAGQVVRVYGFAQDITEQKQAEEALRHREALLNAIVDSLPVGLLIFDVNDNLVRSNRALSDIWGELPATLKLEDWVGYWPGTGQRLKPQDWPCARALAGGEAVTQVLEIERFDNRQHRFDLVNASPVRDSNGQIIGAVAVQVDITERKRAEEELRALKDKLELRVRERTAELLTANQELESFAYTVTHDLRAPLRHVTMFVDFLRERIGAGLDDTSREFMDTISQGAGRMDKLIEDLLMLSRLDRAEVREQPVRLAQMVEEVRQELRPAARDREIEWRVEPLPTVRGDATLLRSVLVNLLGNAVKYTRGRTPARIEVGSEERESELVIFVRDNGAGFDMKFANRLFGAFQRLHTTRQFEGTGVGLASVRRIIQRHGGRTWAEGAVGQGATFYFSLPWARCVACRGGGQREAAADGAKAA